MRKFYFLIFSVLFVSITLHAENILVVGINSGNASYDSYMVEIQKIADAISTLDGMTADIQDADVVTSGTFDFSGYDAIVITEASGSSTIAKIGTYTDAVVKAIPVVNMKMYAIHDGKGGWNWCPSADFFGSTDGWDSTKVAEQAVMKIIADHDIFGGRYNTDDEVVLFENEWKGGAHFQGCTFENSAVADIKSNSEALGTSTFIEDNSPDKPAFMLWAIEESPTSKRNVIWGIHSQFSEGTDDYYFILKNSLLWVLKKETIKYTGTNKIHFNASLNVYPNPAIDYVNVNFYNNSNGLVKISLYEITGRKVMETYKNMTAGNIHEIINLKGIESGMYMIYIQTENGNYPVKISLK